MSTSLLKAYRRLVDSGRLQSNPNQSALLEGLAALQSQLARPSHGIEGLYIYGSVGTGKSRLADLFTATLPDTVTRRRTHFHEFMLDVHRRLHHARNASDFAGDPLVRIGQEMAKESRLLCFDEFQVSDIADAMILKRLFGGIWSAGGVLVSTSNRHPDQLYENGLNRALFLPFVEDLKRKCRIWRLGGEQDYRLSPTAQREDVYFTDKPAFQASLARATTQTSPTLITVPVMMNRVLRVRAYEGRDSPLRPVVNGTFEELCERNLGSADYHALCDTASSLYISGIRQFRRNQTELDYVRRLVTLIDVAYERKTKVVCLADCRLTELFSNVAPAVASQLQRSLSVRKEGGSSSSMNSTFIGDTEWSATGLQSASLATGGAGETDARFAIGRAISRLTEMGRTDYGLVDPIG
ncbi:hypothetical protein LTR08_004087 [Meristemomyces frigidus]|nr:hypothetical protein LTR08_004087 [Meristemomyces frigidus]